MLKKLQPGTFHGRAIKSLRVADFILTESAHEANSSLPRHAHENSYFCLALQGGYTERYWKREVVLRPAIVTYRPSGQTHQAQVHNADCRVFMLEISPEWIERLKAESISLKTNTEFCGGSLARLCARLNQEFHRTDTAAKLAIEGLALELLAEAARQRFTGIGTIPPWLKQAREMIVDNFPEALTLTEIAALVGVHPVYLATAFRQKFGTTIGEFVRMLKIEHACAELTNSELSLAAIALQAGFVDQSHFSKVFKQYVGTTPGKYRNRIHSS